MTRELWVALWVILQEEGPRVLLRQLQAGERYAVQQAGDPASRLAVVQGGEDLIEALCLYGVVLRPPVEADELAMDALAFVLEMHGGGPGLGHITILFPVPPVLGNTLEAVGQHLITYARWLNEGLRFPVEGER